MTFVRAGLGSVLLAIIACGVASCAPRGIVMSPEHPADPAAPTGRLAGPPPALWPGIAESVPPGADKQPAAPGGHEVHPPAPPTQPPSEHEGHR